MISRIILSLFVCLLSTCALLCSDFNDGTKAGIAAGLRNLLTCPYNRIGSDVCTEPFPRISLSDSSVSWNDVVIFVIVNSKGIRRSVVEWWLQFLTNSMMDGSVMNLVLIADACTSSECTDAATAFQSDVQSNSTLSAMVKVSVVRGQSGIDSGYQRLACKLITGISAIYKLFPNRAYYFKIDDDTVIFPRRLLHFVNSLHAVTNSTAVPLYFGTVSHLHKTVPLCGEMGWVPNPGEQGGGHPTYSRKGLPPEGYLTCYAQGGAGYGLNNLAMRSLAATAPCTRDMDLESESEDTYVGFALFRNLNATLIHCDSFRPSGHSAESHMAHAISFHHISDHWLNSRNVSDMKDKYPDLF